MTFAPTDRINRYYDPSTDQFLSVDPDVQSTDQPYVFVNDDPLNATNPLGLYKYKDTELIGSVSQFGSASNVFTYFKDNLATIFPFKVSGPKDIKDGTSLRLDVDPSLIRGVGTVKVGDVTSKSLTFTVTSNHYFDPAGSTITFSTSQSNGNVYLSQTANAPGAGTLSNLIAPTLAAETWQNQASNLTYSMAGVGTCHENIGWQIVDFFTNENVC